MKTLFPGGSESPIRRAALFPALAPGGGVSGASLDPVSRGALLAMAGMEINRDVIGHLLAMGGYCAPHRHYFAGPIVVHGQAHPGCLPAWLPPAIYQDRLEQIFAEAGMGHVGDRATLAEVAAVLMTASSDAPIGPDWTRVYVWAAAQAYNRRRAARAGAPFEEQLARQGDLPPGSVPETLSERERRAFLEPLQREIREKVVRAAGERRGRPGRPMPPPAGAPSLPGFAQLDLLTQLTLPLLENEEEEGHACHRSPAKKRVRRAVYRHGRDVGVRAGLRPRRV
jgi:hypothetical protein